MPRLAEVATAALLLVGCCFCRAHAYAASPCGHCCHDGHYCAMDDASWLLRWIIYVKRASLVWLMLSGLILYYIPETRAPVKKGCYLLIDVIADNLKTFVGKLDDEEAINEGELQKELFISKSFMHEFSNCLPNSYIEETNPHNLRKKLDCASVSFNLPENEVLRQRPKKSRFLQHKCKNTNQLHRQLQSKIHHPCSKKFKEKSSHDKVSVCPLPLMQFDNSERQNLKTSYALSNDNCGPCLPSNYDHEEVMNNVPLIKEKYCLSNTYSYVRMRSGNNSYEDSFTSEENSPKKKSEETCRHHKGYSDEDRQSSLPEDTEILIQQPMDFKLNHTCEPFLNDNENKSFDDKQILQNELSKLPLLRALKWIFGGCPSAKHNDCNKGLSQIVQERLSDFF